MNPMTDISGGSAPPREDPQSRDARPKPSLRLPLANPIFLREMREAMRAEARTDPWRLRLLVLFGLMGAVLYGTTAAGVYHVAAPMIAFYFLSLVEAIYVMRPVDPTSIVAREKQQNTFESLLLTPLTPGRFLSGHLLFHLALAGRRIAVMLPLFGALYILGGFSLGQFLAYQILLLVYLVAANSTLMAAANTQPALTEGAAAAIANRRGARRQAPAANLNPAALLAYFLLPLIAIAGPAVLRGTFLSGLLVSGTSSAPPALDLVKFLALVHPFLALLVWGDALVFGWPVPVWIVCVVFWCFVALTSSCTFVHQVMIRKFRPDLGYRLSRWILVAVTGGMIAGLAWRLPHLAAAACAVLGAFYAGVRFSNPMGVPVTEHERWQLLPRKDLFVHRAGNLFPFLVAVLLPLWAVQALLVRTAGLPGLELAVLYLNAEAFLTVAALLLIGLILRMRRLAPDSGKVDTTKTAPLTPDGEGASGEKNRTAGTPANPAVGVAIVLWLIPLALLGLEPLLRGTPAGGTVSALTRGTEPLLLLNPLRFAWLLMSENSGAMLLVSGKPLDVSGPPPLPRTGIIWPVDYYEASLLAGVLLVGGLMIAYAVTAARREKRQRAAAVTP